MHSNAEKGAILTVLSALVLAFMLALAVEPAGASTTFIVTETGDAGDSDITDSRCDTDPATTGKQCTLRAAIQEANDTAGADTIAFDIGSGTGSKTISPNSELPAITETVTIDGYTQPGASPNTLAEGDDAVLNVQLDGINAGGSAGGFQIETSDCTIEGLVIKRFQLDGVWIVSGTGNRIEGNFIGVSRDGTTDRGNGGGVFVRADSNTVGGTGPESRNVISGNTDHGVIVNTPGTENSVEGNYIGTTADGTGDLGNAEVGVNIFSPNNTIGGTTEGARNVISGNDRYGVVVQGTEATYNVIEGNYIGAPADGTGDLGNTDDGVLVASGAWQTAVGEPDGGGNIIAHNGGDGVSVKDSDTTGTYVLFNRIFDNGGLGIDLLGGTEKASGVTTNDAGDGDTGPNNLQNFPVITSVEEDTPSPGQTTISGTLNSTSPYFFDVQCFLTSKAPASKHGEGARLLDTALAWPTSSSADTWSFSCVSSDSSLGKAEGQTVTATATNDWTGDTSEFSKNKAVPYSP
jgi:CSLREA domain-containing protein